MFEVKGFQIPEDSKELLAQYLNDGIEIGYTEWLEKLLLKCLQLLKKLDELETLEKQLKKLSE